MTTPTPATDFPYTMRTTQMMEHSQGIAWTAELLYNGVRVGQVEQLGHGGADEVTCDSPQERAQWYAAVAAAFGGNEEAATYWLMEQEDSEK